MPVRVVVGVFSPLITGGLGVALQRDPGLRVVATALDPSAIPPGVAGDVDVVVLDDHAVQESGVFVEVEDRWPGVGILVLAHEPARAYCLRLLSLGARACVSTDAPVEEILSAVHLAADGQHLLVSAGTLEGVSEHREGLHSLTPRERAVLRQLSAGSSNPQIALELHIAVETARSHVASIYRKLGVNNRHQLAGVDLRAVAFTDGARGPAERQHSSRPQREAISQP